MSSDLNGSQQGNSPSSIYEFAKLIEQQNNELVELIKSNYSYVSLNGKENIPLCSKTNTIYDNVKCREVFLYPKKVSASANCIYTSKRSKLIFPIKPLGKRIENPFKSLIFHGENSKEIFKEVIKIDRETSISESSSILS